MPEKQQRRRRLTAVYFFFKLFLFSSGCSLIKLSGQSARTLCRNLPPSDSWNILMPQSGVLLFFRGVSHHEMLNRLIYFQWKEAGLQSPSSQGRIHTTGRKRNSDWFHYFGAKKMNFWRKKKYACDFDGSCPETTATTTPWLQKRLNRYWQNKWINGNLPAKLIISFR